MTDQTQETPNETPEEQPTGQPTNKTQTEGSGLAPNVAGALCYVLGLITGIIFLLIEKDNKFIRFHAIQSILFSIAIWTINFIVTTFILASLFSGAFAIAGLLSSAITILFVVIWVMLMVKAYNNEEWELPIIGKIAKNSANK